MFSMREQMTHLDDTESKVEICVQEDNDVQPVDYEVPSVFLNHNLYCRHCFRQVGAHPCENRRDIILLCTLKVISLRPYDFKTA